jgi:hypothetical protein
MLLNVAGLAPVTAVVARGCSLTSMALAGVGATGKIVSFGSVSSCAACRGGLGATTCSGIGAGAVDTNASLVGTVVLGGKVVDTRTADAGADVVVTVDFVVDFDNKEEPTMDAGPIFVACIVVLVTVTAITVVGLGTAMLVVRFLRGEVADVTLLGDTACGDEAAGAGSVPGFVSTERPGFLLVFEGVATASTRVAAGAGIGGPVTGWSSADGNRWMAGSSASAEGDAFSAEKLLDTTTPAALVDVAGNRLP